MMESELIPHTIELLRDFETIKNDRNEYEYLMLMDFFIDKLHLLKNHEDVVAMEIKHSRAEKLLPTMKLYDFKGVQKIEQMLQYI